MKRPGPASTVRSFNPSLSSSVSTTAALSTINPRPLLWITPSRSAFIVTNRSAMDAHMPSVKDAFAR